MITQIRYFQAIVQYGSFTEAAEQCHISQSAISQQISSLENTLGVSLFDRKKRKVTLTEQGEFFYRNSLVLIADLERIIRDTQKIKHENSMELRLGYSVMYGGEELQKTIAVMAKKYPNLEISITSGSHEYLSDLLMKEELDMIMMDQRKAFSSRSNNLVLQKYRCFLEVSRENPISRMNHVEPGDLRNVPCIIVATSDEQKEKERTYIEETFGIHGTFLYTTSIKDARLMLAANKGIFPVEGEPILSHFDATICRIPFMSGGQPVDKNLCVFWLKDNSGYYIEEFADLLRQQFGSEEEVQ